MERSEPALVPEWLRNAGSVSGTGSSTHHSSSTSPHTDSSSVVHHTRNKPSKSTSDFESPPFERTSSSNSRRNSSNGSTKHAYSSFNRGHREKDRDREKERSNFGDYWDRDSVDPLTNIFSGRIERDALRRSHSMVSRKQSELLPRRVVVDAKNGGKNSQNNSNGMLSGVSIGSSFQKAVFDKDFPSLGTEEKPGIAEIVRVSSPVLAAATSPSLPVGNPALIGGEGWTSALAEVPAIIGGSGTGSTMVQQIVATTSGSAAPSTTPGLNMAEALVQTPSRARATTQASVKTQRLEELAIKQSRQLIPVLSSFEKSKPKITARNAEINVPAKSMTQQPSSLIIANQSICSGNVKSEVPKTSGKFTDLKSVVWEIGVSPTSKDVSSPTTISSSRPGNQLTVASAASSTPSRNSNNLKSPTERNPTFLDLKLSSAVDKKPSLSQVQSRNDFFNLIKKKTLMNSSTVLPDSGPGNSSRTIQKSGEVTREVVSSPTSPQPLENGAEVTSNGDAFEDVHGLPDSKRKDTIPSEEEEFLRSLGWEENSGEDEGLTEEEINAFYQEYMKVGPTTFKLCQGMQPKAV